MGLSCKCCYHNLSHYTFHWEEAFSVRLCWECIRPWVELVSDSNPGFLREHSWESHPFFLFSPLGVELAVPFFCTHLHNEPELIGTWLGKAWLLTNLTDFTFLDCDKLGKQPQEFCKVPVLAAAEPLPVPSSQRRSILHPHSVLPLATRCLSYMTVYKCCSMFACQVLAVW